jgi:hypothetical protein
MLRSTERHQVNYMERGLLILEVALYVQLSDSISLIITIT